MVDSNSPVRKRSFRDNDWKQIAEQIHQEWVDRKKRRADLEKRWKQVDRQLSMDPIKMVEKATGQAKAWFPELELPNQAESLEVLMADARRLIFADDRNYFSARAHATDAELAKIDLSAIVSGDTAEVPSRIEGEDLEAIIEGVITSNQDRYDYRGVWDLLNGEAFKYGAFVGRMAMVSDDKFDNHFSGIVRRSSKFPALVPRSIKNVYLDDSVTAVMHQGMMVGPATVECRKQNLDDLKMAAKKGSSDPTQEMGGWMAARIRDVEPDKNNMVDILEWEGDLIVTRSSGPNMFLPNSLVSVVVGQGGPTVFRYRENPYPFRSYFSQGYHHEDVESAYATSPLMKGAPVQNAATTAWNRFMQAVILNAEPPLKYNPNDQYLQQTGGPVIEPGAQWGSLSDIEVIQIGDPLALQGALVMLLQLYSDVVGVNAPRLGAQTKSHQTAFAVDTEQNRGQVRTVDYVHSVMYGGMKAALNMEYFMLRKSMQKGPIYIPKYKAFVDIGKEFLPENVTFDVHGAAGPLEEREREAEQQNAINLALQIDNALVQTGREPNLDPAQIQRALLDKAFRGFTDIERFFIATSQGSVGGIEDNAGLFASDEGLEGTPSDALAELAALSGQQ